MSDNTKSLHPRSKHNNEYDFDALVKVNQALSQYVHMAKSGRFSIDFHNAQAVVELNKALLLQHYDLSYWSIPHGYLCPGVPGRAEYIHKLSDLLFESNGNKSPKSNGIRGLDIGTGSSLIYPIIAVSDYGWQMVASEYDKKSLGSAKQIIEKNESLNGNVALRVQENAKHIFIDVINADDYFDFAMCNPPFFSSQSEAVNASLRKNRNLKKESTKENNFQGSSNELWCDGGEYAFVHNMIKESQEFSNSCYWFTTLISDKTHIPPLLKETEKIKATQAKVIEIKLGNKISRLLCWSFLSLKQSSAWRALRW